MFFTINLNFFGLKSTPVVPVIDGETSQIDEDKTEEAEEKEEAAIEGQ